MAAFGLRATPGESAQVPPDLASAELRFSEMNMSTDELTLYPPAAP